MRKIIRHLRKKPRDVRQQMLYGITFFTFVTMIGLWIIVQDARSREKESINKTKSAESPFVIVGDSIRGALDSLKNK